MKRYRLKRIPITSESYMEVDMMNGKWVQLDDLAELTRKLDVLRDEVKAWRDWDANCGVELHPDNIEGCSCEGVNRVENVLNARQATDAAKGLE